MPTKLAYRNGARPRDVSRGELGFRTDIEQEYLPPLQASRELVAVNHLDAVAIAEIRARQPFDAGDVVDGDIA